MVDGVQQPSEFRLVKLGVVGQQVPVLLTSLLAACALFACGVEVQKLQVFLRL